MTGTVPDIYRPAAHTPIIGVDIWEHVRNIISYHSGPCTNTLCFRLSTFRYAYQLLMSAHSSHMPPSVQKCQARRKCLSHSLGTPRFLILFVQYLNAIWSVINFKEAETRFADATK